MGIYKSKKASKKEKQEVQKAGKGQGGDQVKNRQSKPANSVKKKTLWVLSNIFQCGKTQIEDASVDSGVPLATIAANLQHPGTYRADYGPGEDIMFTTHDGKRCYGDFSENNYSARPRTHTVKTMSGSSNDSSAIFGDFSEKNFMRGRTNTMNTTDTADYVRGMRSSNDDVDAIRPAPLRIHNTDGHSDVSRPPPPARLRHLSELIDPLDLTEKSHVRSPSGNILGAAEFMMHPGRPRSIRERQENIREKVRSASRLAIEAKLAQEAEEAARKEEKKKEKKRIFGWCL